MAGTEVSNVIKDILDAFQNGLDFFKGTRRKHRRRHSEPSNVNEDKQIHESLSQRPHEIKEIYAQSVAKHGHRFEIGDSTAQTSLAQILLVLNTGLIKMLNHVMSNDKNRSQSRRGIFHLSETAAIETLTALSDLNLRMVSKTKLDIGLPASGQEAHSHKGRKDRPRAHSCSQPQQLKRPPPAPLRHYGGWVRSKSDPSVVSVVVSNRARKADPKRSPTPRAQSVAPVKLIASQSGTSTPTNKSPPPRYSQLATKPAPALKPKPDHLQAKSNLQTPDPKPPVEEQMLRCPSMYIVPADFFDDFSQPASTRYPSYAIDEDQRSPMRPPKVPLHSRPQQHQTRLQDITEASIEAKIRPQSMMTFMTASTKIGEIPEHKLPDRELTEEQQEQVQLPYVLPDLLDPPKRRGGRGLKFWKRERQERVVVGSVGA